MLTFDQLNEFFSRHERVMLQFSAGKDSAAVLWLLQPWWDRMDIVWANPGNPYPETLAYMKHIEKLVPRFRVVLGNQPADIKQNGWPVDLVPLEATPFMMQASRVPRLQLRPFWQCCNANMWQPMLEWVKHGNYSGVIRGEKQCDTLKGPLTSGSIVDGVEYLLPIEDWTDEEVFQFLGPERTPASYQRGLRSSLDCRNCTAYTAENPGRIADLLSIDAAAWNEVSAVHLILLDSLSAHTEAIRSCHGDA